MKKLFIFFCMIIFSVTVYAQTVVPEKNLGKTLEKNKDANAVIESSINLSEIRISNGKVKLPIFEKNKISIVSEIDMTDIEKRISYANRTSFKVIFVVKNIESKTYAIKKIEGIESYEEYKNRLANEEEKRIQEENERKERERLANLTQLPVVVLRPATENISEKWLPGLVQDRLKENLQSYLGMRKIVSDSEKEKEIKKLQAESESTGRDEKYAIEIGKITSASYGLFSTIRKTGTGYIISIDFTNLTNGEQIAICSSKEYTNAEYLCDKTGGVDSITLKLAEKLNIKVSDANKNILKNGSGNLSVDEQFEIAKQNEEKYQIMMKNYDEDIERLSLSNDINALQQKQKIEVDRALTEERKQTEKIRLAELNAQKKRLEDDAILEAERSFALKTQRDQMAKQASEKAAEVRKLKFEKQGVLGQINVIESKKKALVEIRQSVERRHQELYEQLIKDRKSEEKRIKNKAYSTVELESDGKPTEAALKRRSNQITKSYEDLTNKFFEDAASVRKITETQDNALLSEIRADQKTLATTRTVSSMGDELKVSFGSYEGSKNGWNAYLSLYSEGILLYTDTFIVNYETLSGKKAPDMEKELDDSVIEEYTNDVDMYSSLLVRGVPILYFEIDYNVIAENDDKPSEYKFNFNKIRIINTLSGKTVQSVALNKVISRTIKPENDLRCIKGIVDKEKEYQNNIALILRYGNLNATEAELVLEKYPSIIEILKDLKKVPNSNFMVSEHSLSVKSVLEIMETHYYHEYNIEPSGNKYYKGRNWYENEISPDKSIEINIREIPQFFTKLNSILRLQDFYLNAFGKNEVKHGNDDFHYEVNLDAEGFRLPYLKFLVETNYPYAKNSEKPLAYHNIPENNIVYFYTFYRESRGYKSLYRCDFNDCKFCDEIRLAIPIKD